MLRNISEDSKSEAGRAKLALRLLVTLALVAFASRAYGQDRLGSYLEVKGGMYSPSSSFILQNINLQNGLRDDTKQGFSGELSVGHFFLPTLALELGAGYFQGKGSLVTSPGLPMNFNVIPVLLTAKALIPIGPVDPFGEVGVGAYFTKFDATANGATFSGSSTLGLHAGAGLNVNIMPTVFIGAEERYISANPSFGGQTITLNNTQYALDGFKLNGFTTSFCLGFNF